MGKIDEIRETSKRLADLISVKDTAVTWEGLKAQASLLLELKEKFNGSQAALDAYAENALGISAGYAAAIIKAAENQAELQSTGMSAYQAFTCLSAIHG